MRIKILTFEEQGRERGRKPAEKQRNKKKRERERERKQGLDGVTLAKTD